MDLTKQIKSTSDKSFYRERSIVCFNFESTNEVYNMWVVIVELWLSDKDAIGAWKIKQLKQ